MKSLNLLSHAIRVSTKSPIQLLVMFASNSKTRKSAP